MTGVETKPREPEALSDAPAREPAGRTAGAAPSVLIVTPLDIDKLLNNLEHHRIDFYTKRGCDVTVVYKTMNQSPRFLDLLRDTLTFSVRERREGGARLIAVDPPFNFFAGLRQNTEQAGEARRSGLRVVLVRLMSPLGALRDVFVTPWLTMAAMRATGVPCEVCLGFGPWGGLVGIALRRLGRVGTLVYEDRDYESGFVPDRLRRWYTRLVERFGIRRADLTISISHLLSDLRRDELARETHVIPSGVEWTRYAPARAAMSPSRTLIYVGNVIAWSGLEHAISAMPRVRETHPDATLDIVGSGVPSYVDHLHRLVEKHALGDAVRFFGHREPEALPALLGAARIGLSNAEPVPFRKYATPLKVIEYMAAGLAVIATEGTEAAGIVTRCECGEAIPYDPSALAETIIRMLGNDDVHRGRRENAIRHSREYDWDRLLSRELELIDQIASPP